MNKIILITVLALLVVFSFFACGDGCKENFCLNGGVCIDGTCFCENGCRGANCEICPEIMAITPAPIIGFCPEAQTNILYQSLPVITQVSAEIKVQNNTVVAKLFLQTKGNDGNIAKGEMEQVIYQAPTDKNILDIVSDTYTSHVEEVKITQESALIHPPEDNNELVEQFEMYIALPGIDLGACTDDRQRINVYFRPIQLSVISNLD